MKGKSFPPGIFYCENGDSFKGNEWSVSELAEGVRSLAKSFDRDIQLLLGGPPFTSEVQREIQNFIDYQDCNLPRRKRSSLGMCAFEENQGVIGYQAMTLLRDANPTPYERDNIGLDKPLNYAHLKLTMTHPDYWGTRVSSDLLQMRLNIARRVANFAVVDIKAENERSLGFFAKHDFQDSFLWQTPKGTVMQRMTRDLSL